MLITRHYASIGTSQKAVHTGFSSYERVRPGMYGLIGKLKRPLHSLVSKKRIPPARNAIRWSNRELRGFAHLFTGDLINVSAWRDQDQEGDLYRNYFSNANTYTISNYDGWRGVEDQVADALVIDLTEPLPQNLQRAFDVVFNRTTLEHIFRVEKAFRNLCALSRDIVIVVVPFLQHLHGPEDGDFWRFSPYSIRWLMSG